MKKKQDSIICCDQWKAINSIFVENGVRQVCYIIFQSENKAFMTCNTTVKFLHYNTLQLTYYDSRKLCS